MPLGRIVAFLSIVAVASVMRADVITVTQTGTVGFASSTVYTTDTYGYFGTPGASLAGYAFNLTASYDTNYFTPVSCGVGCTGYVAASPNGGTLALTINGITVMPDASAGTNLVFETSASNTTPFFQEVGAGFGVGFLSSEDPMYWLPLTGLNSIDFANIGFGTASSETLALSVETSVSTSAPSPVPEPGALPLAATGVVGLFAAGMVRRFR